MALPMFNPAVENTSVREAYADMAEKMKYTFAGLDFEFTKGDRPAAELSKEERLQTYEMLYNRGGLDLWLGMYFEALFSEELNEELYQFWRSKTIPRIKNPVNVSDRISLSRIG